jgi:hypothetical protein
MLFLFTGIEGLYKEEGMGSFNNEILRASGRQ